MSDVEALAEVLLASWRSQGMLHPPFDSDHDDAVKDAEAILASDWLAAHVAAERDRAVREALRESGFDNADLARQLTHACERRQAAFDEGYDKAMSDAHVSLDRFGYLQRLGESNGNPYRAALPDDREEAGA